jgi:uncharacterized protein with FMN-binding domain
MAGLARRLAPAAALGGLAVVIVGVADPALAGRSDVTSTGVTAQGQSGVAAPQAATSGQVESPAQADTQAQPDTSAQSDTSAQADAATSCDNGDQVTGQTAMTRWGPVQVSATVAGGQVCEVHGVVWPDGDGRSQMINAYAIPQLDAMASASPTQFDYVSGATYTSQGYHDSLQSILDSL